MWTQMGVCRFLCTPLYSSVLFRTEIHVVEKWLEDMLGSSPGEKDESVLRENSEDGGLILDTMLGTIPSSHTID